MTKEQIEKKAMQIADEGCELISKFDIKNPPTYHDGAYAGAIEMAYWLFDHLWISVEDELPEIKEHYVSDEIICRYSDNSIGISQLKENIFGQKWFLYDGDEDESYITHWMPIPKLNEI